MMRETWEDYADLWRGAFDDRDVWAMWWCRVGLLGTHVLLAFGVGFVIQAIVILSERF